MKKFLAFIQVLLLLSAPAYALTSEENALYQLLSYAENNQAEQAKEYITKQSHPLFERLLAHDLIHLLPSEVKAVKTFQENGFHYTRFSDPSKNHNQSVVLAFIEENGLLKLDLNETFRVGFGENWPQTIDTIEQSYIFAKQYYGEEKSAMMLKTFLKGK